MALLPAYAKNFLPWSVTSRPLDGEAPTIDLVIGYNKTNASPILGLFLSRVDKLKRRSANALIVGAKVTVFSATAPFSPMISKVDRLMLIVSETEQISKRRNPP